MESLVDAALSWGWHMRLTPCQLLQMATTSLQSYSNTGWTAGALKVALPLPETEICHRALRLGSTKLRKSEPICTTVRPVAPVSRWPAWQKHFSCPMWTTLCHSFYSVQKKTQWLELWSITHVKCASQKRQHWKIFSNQLFLLGVLHLVIWEVSRMAIPR